MMAEQVDAMCKQLHAKTEVVLVLNVSNVLLYIPLRIISKAGVNDRCFWEAECPTKLNP
jgi:hypothetical protein